MIELYEHELNMPNRQSSKGNQLKFLRDGIWYKADYLGYEGLTEYTVSKLLAYSTLDKSEYVDYDLEQISYNGQVFNACRSRDFRNGWQLITLERLFKQNHGTGLNSMIYSVEDHHDRLKTIVQQVENETGIRDFGKYISKTVTVDSLFLNEDRHTHNLAVMTNDSGIYRPAPIFDNGAGLLSDTTLEYPLGREYYSYIDKAKPKTFCNDFIRQVEVAEDLYGQNVRFSFGYDEVADIVNQAEQYSVEIRSRVIDIVMQMRRRHEYLFDKKGNSAL